MDRVDGRRLAWVVAAGVTAGAASCPAGTVRAASFDCLVDPSLSLKIGSPVASTLGSVSVERGDRVHKGQELARLESGVEQSTVNLDKARADSTTEIEQRAVKVAMASLDFQRARKLQDSNNIAAQKVDEARTNYSVAQGDLALAELNQRLAALELGRAQALLDQRVIRSPIDGVVVQRLLGPGEYVSDTAAVVVVAQTDPLFVEAFLPVAAYGHVKVGDTAQVTARLPGAPVRTAVVSTIDTVLDASSGTFGVRLRLPNGDQPIPAGLRCRVAFSSVPAAVAERSGQAGPLPD